MIAYYLLVLSLAFVDHPIFGRSFGGITVEKLVGAAALLYAIGHLALRKTKPVFVDTWPARAVLAFVLVSLCSYLTFGRNVVEGQTFGFQPFNFLLLLFMTVSVVDSIQRLRWSLLAALGSIAWASLYMLREWQVGSASYGYNYRPGFVVGDPNYFASSALLCLPMACYFARSMPKRWMRWCCAGCVLLILAGVTVSGSRGGAIGLFVTVLMMIWQSKRRVRALIVVTVLFAVFLIISPFSPLDRLVHPSSSDKSATDVRVTLWKAAWKMFRDHPIIGVGYGNFSSRSPRYIEEDLGRNFLVHNQYLEMLSEMGAPGLLLAYCGMYLGSFVSLNYTRRAAKRAGSLFLTNAALGIQIGLIGFAISVFFLSASFLRLFWLMISISACLPALAADAVVSKRRLRRLRENQHSLDSITAPSAPLRFGELMSETENECRK